MQGTINVFLFFASIINAVIALIHFACLVWGTPVFRFLGAGEPIIQMSIDGHWYPGFVAFAIGVMFSVWSLYALSAAGVIIHLPFVRIVLSIITFIYILRAVLYPVMKPAFPGNSDTFWLISSAISLIIGLVHFAGLRQEWNNL